MNSLSQGEGYLAVSRRVLIRKLAVAWLSASLSSVLLCLLPESNFSDFGDMLFISCLFMFTYGVLISLLVETLARKSIVNLFTKLLIYAFSGLVFGITICYLLNSMEEAFYTGSYSTFISVIGGVLDELLYRKMSFLKSKQFLTLMLLPFIVLAVSMLFGPSFSFVTWILFGD